MKGRIWCQVLVNEFDELAESETLTDNRTTDRRSVRLFCIFWHWILWPDESKCAHRIRKVLSTTTTNHSTHSRDNPSRVSVTDPSGSANQQQTTHWFSITTREKHPHLVSLELNWRKSTAREPITKKMNVPRWLSNDTTKVATVSSTPDNRKFARIIFYSNKINEM